MHIIVTADYSYVFVLLVILVVGGGGLYQKIFCLLGFSLKRKNKLSLRLDDWFLFFGERGPQKNFYENIHD